MPGVPAARSASRIVFLLLFLSASAAAAQEPQLWVVLRKTDGTTLSGTLISQGADGIRLRSGDLELLVPLSEISELASGTLDADTASGEPAPAAAPPPFPGYGAPPPPAYDPEPWRKSPAFLEYQRRRLQLVDKRGRAIGPWELGFPERDFDEANDQRFYAVVAGDPRKRLSFGEFLELADHDGLRELWEEQLRLARAKTTTGAIVAGVSAALLIPAIAIPAATLETGWEDQAVYPMTALCWGFSIGGQIAGIWTLGSGLRWQGRLHGSRLDYVWDRDEAWEGVAPYNAELRGELGLPDEPEMDGPERRR
jgi:hypothetical protein